MRRRVRTYRALDGHGRRMGTEQSQRRRQVRGRRIPARAHRYSPAHSHVTRPPRWEPARARPDRAAAHLAGSSRHQDMPNAARRLFPAASARDPWALTCARGGGYKTREGGRPPYRAPPCTT